MTFDRAALLDDLTNSQTGEEGFRRVVYDDKQPSVPLKPGIVIKGTLTIGHGLTWLTEDESRSIIAGRLPGLEDSLESAFPWYANLSEPRQRALADMAYNLGLAGLQSFTTFLLLIQEGKFDEAADDLATTKWAGQVGSRAVKIAALIRTGAIA